MNNKEYRERVAKYIDSLNYNEVDDATKYALDVYHKRIIASQMVWYQCFRHLLFLYKSIHEEDFPYVYKKNPLKFLIEFCKNIIIPQTNKPFIFPAFRKFMAGFIFGWRYKEDPERLLTTEIFDVEARKQWKSSFWAMMILAVCCGFTNDSFCEVYTSGPTRESSRIPYDTACAYLIKSPIIASHFSTWNSIHIKAKNGSIVKHLPFEKSAIEGKNFSIGILTEYHLHVSDEVQESFKSSRNLARKNQIIIYDTTKGKNIDSVCYMREKAYKQFLKNQCEENIHTLTSNNDIFLFCAELDEEDYANWRDKNLWIKSNPNLNISVSLEQLEQEFNKISSAEEEVEFKTKRLGMWVGSATAHFNLSDLLESDRVTKPLVKKWINNKHKLFGSNFCAIDLSSIHDTTHAVLNIEIPQDDGEPIWYFIGHGFIPNKSVSKKEIADQASYRDWVDKDFCSITKGDIVDYDYLVEKIIKLKNEYGIDKIGYDPWAFNIVKQMFIKQQLFLEEDMVAVNQGVKLSPIFKEFERKLRLKKICFGGNNMLISHALNVVTKNLNGTSENVLVMKISPNKRIDGFIAMLMASHMRWEANSHNGEIKSIIVNPSLS